MAVRDGVLESPRASAANADSMLDVSVRWLPNSAVRTASENAVLRSGDKPALWLIVSVRMWLMGCMCDRQASCSFADIDGRLADDWR